MITQKEYKTLKKMCNDYEKAQRINAIKEKFEFIDFLNIFEYEIKNKNNINLIYGQNKFEKLTIDEVLFKIKFIYENEDYENLEEFYEDLEKYINKCPQEYHFEADSMLIHIYNKIKPYIEYNEEQARLHWEQVEEDYKDLGLD